MARGILLFLFIVLGLYFGVGSFVSVEIEQLRKIANKQEKDEVIGPNQLKFKNPSSLWFYLQQQRADKVFPWVSHLPLFVNMAIGSAAFGLLGGAMRIVKELFLDRHRMDVLHVVTTGVFGLFTGLMLLGMSYVLPAALTRDSDVQIRPASLLFLCFFGGLFCVRVFQWLETLVDRLFPVTSRERPLGDQDEGENQ